MSDNNYSDFIESIICSGWTAISILFLASLILHETFNEENESPTQNVSAEYS